MRAIFHILLLGMVLLPWSDAYGQQDTLPQSPSENSGGSSYRRVTVYENVPKSKFWGNSWHAATSYNLSRSHEFDLNVGRTYGAIFCSGGGCMSSTHSWGLGYGVGFRDESAKHLTKAYYEHTFFYFPPFSYALRLEYIYDVTDEASYLRPSVGLSLIYFDLLYNYSILLNGNDNLLGHGVSLRFRLYQTMDNWQTGGPKRIQNQDGF